MKIIIAPDSFKESLSASAVADAIERGLRRALPDAEYVKLPIADGGEGTVDALINATAGQLIFVPVSRGNVPAGLRCEQYVARRAGRYGRFWSAKRGDRAHGAEN